MNLRRCLRFLLVGLTLTFSLHGASAQEKPAPPSAMPSVVQVPAAALPSDHFDAEAATEAYLAQIPAAAKTRSDAYFEGGYWLIL
jgi:STE24 endopeptidase